MKIFNTLTRMKEEFVPMEEGKVKLYACGPTVYNYFHLGNARPFVTFDTLRRYLEYRGYDVTFCQSYFRDTEHRDPSVTELRVIDTYWSDHCRHTTFLTRLSEVEIEKAALGSVIEDALKEYYATRDEVYGKDTDRIVSLMDMALMGMKSLKKKGMIPDLDESDEINACSIEVPVAYIASFRAFWLTFSASRVSWYSLLPIS